MSQVFSENPSHHTNSHDPKNRRRSGSSSVVESRLPKPLVAGSIPVSRSIFLFYSKRDQKHLAKCLQKTLGRKARPSPLTCTASILTFVACLASCAPQTASTTAPEKGAHISSKTLPSASKNSEPNQVRQTRQVQLEVMATLNGDTLEIIGKTDLPDNTLVTYEVYHETFLPVANADMTRKGITVVQKQNFSATVNLTGWSAGTVVVNTNFMPGLTEKKQPPEIIKNFGTHGELLEGKNVFLGSGQKRVVARTEVPR